MNNTYVSKEVMDKVVYDDARVVLGLMRDAQGYGICSMRRDIRNAIEDMIDDISWFYVNYEKKVAALEYLNSALLQLDEAYNCVIECPAQSLHARMKLMCDIINAKQRFEEAESLDMEPFNI